MPYGGGARGFRLEVSASGSLKLPIPSQSTSRMPDCQLLPAAGSPI